MLFLKLLSREKFMLKPFHEELTVNNMKLKLQFQCATAFHCLFYANLIWSKVWRGNHALDHCTTRPPVLQLLNLTEPEYQHPYSPQQSPYLSYSTSKENLLNNQNIFSSDHLLHSHVLHVRSGSDEAKRNFIKVTG